MCSGLAITTIFQAATSNFATDSSATQGKTLVYLGVAWADTALILPSARKEGFTSGSASFSVP